jgi:hypothetical protein
VQTRLGSFVECVLAAVVVVYLAACSNPGPQPNPLPTPVASPAVPSRTASSSPSAEEQDLRKAERAVHRFWRVIDRLSADPSADLTVLTTVSRGSAAAQWARNINQYRFDQVKAKGRVAVHDVMARESKDDDLYTVTACIDASQVDLVDNNGKSAVPPEGPRRVSYDYTVERDRKKWYVIKEKATKTC